MNLQGSILVNSSMVTKKFPLFLFQARKLFPGFGDLEASLVRFLAPSSSLALANEGLFELTRHPLLIRVWLSFAETTKNQVVVM